MATGMLHQFRGNRCSALLAPILHPYAKWGLALMVKTTYESKQI